jgi:hypothetical protein
MRQPFVIRLAPSAESNMPAIIDKMAIAPIGTFIFPMPRNTENMICKTETMKMRMNSMIQVFV